MTSIFRRKGRKGWTLQYRDLTGKLRMRSFKTRAAAEDEALRLRDSPDPGRILLLRDHAVAWLTRRKPLVRLATWEANELYLRLHILPTLGHLRLDYIARAQVKDLLAAKLAGGMAANSIRHLRSTLHSCLEEACEDGLLRANPAKIRLRLPQPHQEEARAMTAAQLNAFLGAAGTRYPLFATLAFTGMRLGEALGLRWEDADFDGRSALVRRTWKRGLVQSTKTGRERVVDLAAALVEALRSHDAATKATALEAGQPRPEWIFTSRAGVPPAHWIVEADFKATLKAAGLPGHFTPHSLRHTYASLMLSMGERITYVQQQLGHRSISMTVDLYGRWLPAGDPQAADRLAANVSVLVETVRKHK